MASQVHPALTPEEYLQRERKAGSKSEYVTGEVFAMAGASEKHNALVNNVSDALPSRKLRECSCSKYNSDMKVYLRDDLVYCYPDLSVCCGEPQFLDAVRDVLLNPSVVFEVLSPSTKSYDLGDKSFYYRRNPSMRHIVLIWHDRVQVGHWSRVENGSWAYEEYGQAEQAITLPEMKVELRLSEIYEGT